MTLFLLLLTLSGDPATCPMHEQHMKEKAAASAHAHDVDGRGDHVMGFSHEKTKHSFRLFADGGAIEVRANDSSDTTSIEAIRGHLKEIAEEFSAGRFGKPETIHGRVPDGVAEMRERAAHVRYVYEELERGARVRIHTNDERAREAVHQFLRFQIADHRTADSGAVE